MPMGTILDAGAHRPQLLACDRIQTSIDLNLEVACVLEDPPLLAQWKQDDVTYKFPE